MPAYNVAEAKAKLSQLLRAAQRGEEVVIANDHKPIARLVPIEPKSRRRKPGSGKGKILHMAADAFAALDDLPIGEIEEWLPYMFTDGEIRKLRKADPGKSPREVLKHA